MNPNNEQIKKLILLTMLLFVSLGLTAQSLEEGEILVFYSEAVPQQLKSRITDSVYTHVDIIEINNMAALRFLVPAGSYYYNNPDNPTIYVLPDMSVICDLTRASQKEKSYYSKDFSFRVSSLFIEYHSTSNSLWAYLSKEKLTSQISTPRVSRIWQLMRVNEKNVNCLLELINRRVSGLAQTSFSDLLKYELDIRAGKIDYSLEVDIPIITVEVNEESKALDINDPQAEADLRAAGSKKNNYLEMIGLIKAQKIKHMHVIKFEGKDYLIFTKK